MTDEERYLEATRRADTARARFGSALARAKARFAPARLRSDAQDRATQALHLAGAKARATVRRHPFALGAVVAVPLAWLLRRPLRALSRSLLVKGRDSYLAYRYRLRDGAGDDSSPTAPRRGRIWPFRKDEG